MAGKGANETLGRAFVDAFVTRDVSAFQRLFHADIVWHVPGRHVHAGVKYGVGEVLTYLSGVFEMAEDSLTFDPHDVLASEGHVVILMNVAGSRRGVDAAIRGAFVLHLDEGQIREVWFHPGDQYTIDEFWEA